MKYKTIEDLLAAFSRFELDNRVWTIVVDNDSAWLRYNGENPFPVDSSEWDEFDMKMNDKANSLWRCDGPLDPIDILRFYGVNAEGC